MCFTGLSLSLSLSLSRTPSLSLSLSYAPSQRTVPARLRSSLQHTRTPPAPGRAGERRQHPGLCQWLPFPAFFSRSLFARACDAPSLLLCFSGQRLGMPQTFSLSLSSLLLDNLCRQRAAQGHKATRFLLPLTSSPLSPPLLSSSPLDSVWLLMPLRQFAHARCASLSLLQGPHFTENQASKPPLSPSPLQLSATLSLPLLAPFAAARRTSKGDRPNDPRHAATVRCARQRRREKRKKDAAERLF